MTSKVGDERTRDYSDVTEVAGEAVRRDAAIKMAARYAFAASRAAGKDVLEIACGSGQGLGLIANVARSVVAGDVTLQLLRDALAHYRDRVLLVCLDAQALPFRDGSFDMLLCYEALYYVQDVDRFLSEAHRVLRSGGELLIVNVNPSWPGFNASPQSITYHNAPALKQMLDGAGFESAVYGAFPESDRSMRSRAVGLARRMAVRFHLVPKTMRGKRLLKRLFYGRLVRLPAELPVTAETLPSLVPLAEDSAEHTVLYAIARRP